MSDDPIAVALARIASALEALAPRTHAALLPPATDAELAAVAAEDPSAFVPFAKDFAGNALGVDPTAHGAVIELYEGERTELAPDLAAYLSELADRMEVGAVDLDDSIEELVEIVDVVLAVGLPAPGEVVDHAILGRLGITATVESSNRTTNRFGYFVRLSPVEGVAIEHVGFTDPRGNTPDDIEHGWESGGGVPGQLAFARAQHQPLPAGSQLRIRLRHTRRI